MGRRMVRFVPGICPCDQADSHQTQLLLRKHQVAQLVGAKGELR
jgi:hypothetical protein